VIKALYLLVGPGRESKFQSTCNTARGSEVEVSVRSDRGGSEIFFLSFVFLNGR
jgi:hypothetical protein